MTTKQWVVITRKLTRMEHILWNLLGYGKPIVQAIKDKTVGDKSPFKPTEPKLKPRKIEEGSIKDENRKYCECKYSFRRIIGRKLENKCRVCHKPIMNDFEKWINNCPKNVPSIEEIRKITAKIPYSMADASMGIYPLQECCKQYAEQYSVNEDEKHYFFNYCPHCRTVLHPETKK